MDGNSLLALIVVGAVVFGVFKFVRNREHTIIMRDIRAPDDENLVPLNLPETMNAPAPHVWTSADLTPADCSDGDWRKLLTDGVHDAVDEDSGEMVTIHPQTASDHVEGLLVSFGYRDASDNPSRRMLLCARCWQEHGALYVRGYCTLRQAFRTFRPDRMTDLKEMRGGALISNPEDYFEKFAAIDDAEQKSARKEETDRRNAEWQAKQKAYEAKYEAARAAKAARKQLEFEARDVCICGLRILAYIALCDGVVSSKESEVQASFIRARLIGVGKKPDDAMVEAMLSIARGLAVPERSFMAAANKIKADGYGEMMLDVAGQLAAADGKTTDKELVALKRLRNAMS
jgi:hypothetical protein